MAQDINIYCDESRYSNPEDPYLVIGVVKCPRERKRGIVRELDALKRNNGIGGEFGWKSVSRNKAAFYTTLIDWFLATDDLRFRCVVANRESLGLEAPRAQSMWCTTSFSATDPSLPTPTRLPGREEELAAAARGHPAGQDGGLHARGLRTSLRGGCELAGMRPGAGG